MPTLDPKDRAERGVDTQTSILGEAPDTPQTLLDETIRDFVFADVWSRPELALRPRYLIALSSEILMGAPQDIIDGLAYGALKSGELSVSDLREASLHLAVYAGWSRGRHLDRAITAAAERLGIAAEPSRSLRSEPWDPAVGRAAGVEEFNDVMLMPPAPAVTPYYDQIQAFVFGEMWCRRELDQRSRRWITLVCVCDAGAEQPIKTHIHAAMATGNCAPDEMHEFALQYGTHCGWPRASLVQAVVLEMAEKVKAGLPWNG